MQDNRPHDVEPDDQHADGSETHKKHFDTSDDPNREPPQRHTPWNSLTARVISFVSRKGGVGKTTSAINLGAALALSGHTVLVVGVDPQCGVSRSLGHGRDELSSGLPEIFTNATALTDLAHPTPLKNLFFTSPNIWSLDEEEVYLDLMDREVDTFVGEIDRARNLYDTILIDCPPNLGAATRAALLASDSFLVPVQAEELCRDSLERLLTFIQSFRSDAFAESNLAGDRGGQQPIALEGMFLTMVSSRTRMSRHVTSKVNEDYAEQLFESVIPRTTRLSEMALRGKPTVIHDRKSTGSRAYFDLSDELMARFHARNGGTQNQSTAGDRTAAVPDSQSADPTSPVQETAFVTSKSTAESDAITTPLAEDSGLDQ